MHSIIELIIQFQSIDKSTDRDLNHLQGIYLKYANSILHIWIKKFQKAWGSAAKYVSYSTD